MIRWYQTTRRMTQDGFPPGTTAYRQGVIPPDQILLHTMLLTGRYSWLRRPLLPNGTRQPAQGVSHDSREVNRPAGTDDWHLICTLRGAGTYGTLDFRHHTGPGELLLWRPGTGQHYQVATTAPRWDRLWFHVQPPTSWLPLLRWPEVEPGLMRLTPSPAVWRIVLRALESCVDEGRDPAPLQARLAFNHLEFALLSLQRDLAQQTVTDVRIDRCIAAILADLGGDWPLTRIAETTGVSSAQVVRLCRRILGESPARLLERLRLEEVCRRLQRDATPLVQIAAELGFTDASHLTRRFRARYTVTPTVWRAAQQRGGLTLPPDVEHHAKS